MIQSPCSPAASECVECVVIGSPHAKHLPHDHLGCWIVGLDVQEPRVDAVAVGFDSWREEQRVRDGVGDRLATAGIVCVGALVLWVVTVWAKDAGKTRGK